MWSEKPNTLWICDDYFKFIIHGAGYAICPRLSDSPTSLVVEPLRRSYLNRLYTSLTVKPHKKAGLFKLSVVFSPGPCSLHRWIPKYNGRKAPLARGSSICRKPRPSPLVRSSQQWLYLVTRLVRLMHSEWRTPNLSISSLYNSKVR
jgi:hypothetical protein